MTRMIGAAAFALLLPAAAVAQPFRACQPRVAIGGAAGLLTHDFPIDPGLAGVTRFGLATTTGTGVEGSVDAAVPVADAWSLKLEYGAGTMAAAVKRDAAGAGVSRRTGDDVLVQRLQLGLQHHRAGRYLCGYGTIGAGLYRYSYRDVPLTVPGGAAALGLEAGHGAGVLFFELGLSVALTTLREPTEAELVTNLRPAFGIRYRF